MQSAAGSRREGATEQAGGCRIRHGVQCLRFSEPWSEQSQNAGPFGIADCDKQARSAAILAAPVPAGSRRYSRDYDGSSIANGRHDARTNPKKPN